MNTKQESKLIVLIDGSSHPLSVDTSAMDCHRLALPMVATNCYLNTCTRTNLYSNGPEPVWLKTAVHDGKYLVGLAGQGSRVGTETPWCHLVLAWSEQPL